VCAHQFLTSFEVIPMPFPSVEHQFKPGQHANPRGRPPGRSITARLRELLESRTIDGQKIQGGKQVADLVAEAIVTKAQKGDYRFCALLLERTEGRAPEQITAEPQVSPGLELLRQILDRLAADAPDPGPEESPHSTESYPYPSPIDLTALS
jgi:hypothetical protein